MLVRKKTGNLVKKIIALCLKHGARLADRGEFSKRAFLNGQTHVDTVTIENIKSEETTHKESVENSDAPVSSEKDECIPESTINEEILKANLAYA